MEVLTGGIVLDAVRRLTGVASNCEAHLIHALHDQRRDQSVSQSTENNGKSCYPMCSTIKLKGHRNR